MRSLFVVIALVLALVLGLWKVLAVPAAPVPAAAIRDRTAQSPEPAVRTASALEDAPAAATPPHAVDPVVEQAGREVRRTVQRREGVQGVLHYPVDVEEHQRVPLPSFVVRLMDGERELARTRSTSSPDEPRARFAFDASPRAPQSLVVEPPPGWVVRPARRFAPHRAPRTWSVSLEVMTIETARASFRFEPSEMPWATCHGEVVDFLGTRVENPRVTLTPVAFREPAPVDRGLAVCRALPRWPYPGPVSTPMREDWHSALLHPGDLALRDRVEAHHRDGSFLADNLVPGTWRLHVQAQGFLPHTEDLELHAGAHAASDVRVVLRPEHAAGAVVVTLTSATGRYEQAVEAILAPRRGVGEVRREVSWSGDPRGRTGRVGSARFDDLPAGDYVVRLAGPDHTPWMPEHARVQPPGEVLFHAGDDDLGRFAFRILDADTGQPLENCDVELSLSNQRLKKYNQPCNAPVLEGYPLDGPLDWVVRAPGFLEARGSRDAFRWNTLAQEGQLLAEVRLARDPAMPDNWAPDD